MSVYKDNKNKIIEQFKNYCLMLNVSQKSELNLPKKCADILLKEYPYKCENEGWKIYIYHSNVYILTLDGNDCSLDTWDDEYVLEFINNF